jgi:hypothetical protein
MHPLVLRLLQGAWRSRAGAVGRLDILVVVVVVVVVVKDGLTLN